MNLTVQQTETLLAIGKLLLTQDNRCTSAPMFTVQQKRSFKCEPGEGDEDVWLDEDWHPVDSETAARLDELDDQLVFFDGEEREEAERELSGKTKRGIKYFWEGCMAAFTEEGCKEYLRQNGHNLTEPRIYAESWNRCPEMLAIRKALMDLATPQTSPA